MTPENLLLPPGTSMMLSRSALLLTIDWQGLTGRHIVQLQATLDDDETNRGEVMSNSGELFRNLVGLEVIADALGAGAGEFPALAENGDESAAEPPDLWHRSRDPNS